jgi:hypothetical protein
MSKKLFSLFLKTKNRKLKTSLLQERLICFIHLSIIHITSGKYPWGRNVSRLLPEVSRGRNGKNI